MLFWATQLSQRHNLNNNELFEIMHNGKATERVNTKKILWINFDGNLSWPYHINNVIQSFYAAHRSLRQFKRFTSKKCQNEVVSYVLCRCVKESDLIKMLSWLSINKSMDFSIAKCCFLALHDPNWPQYLPIKLQE